MKNTMKALREVTEMQGMLHRKVPVDDKLISPEDRFYIGLSNPETLDWDGNDWREVYEYYIEALVEFIHSNVIPAERLPMPTKTLIKIGKQQYTFLQWFIGEYK
jgi:hypothetical protein